MKLTAFAFTLALAMGAATAAPAKRPPAKPFVWENATIYFVLTDRFNNGNPANDHAYGRKDDAAPLRGFMGGDFAGITAKIRAGYFKDLGVDALWITPPVEQIHASTDEGSGNSYGFHGYWARDFTSVDANLGTEADLHELVDTAHANGIRMILDVVLNHTGPVTPADPVWPAAWVRETPVCTFKDAKTTIDCALVANLPDVRTDVDTDVALPAALAEKWQQEGRLARENAELDAFFKRTGHPRAPRYYLIKWQADWVRKYGFDGIRADTVKHTEPAAWKDLKTEASLAYEDWKRAHPRERLGDDKFWMTAEVYNFTLQAGHRFDMGGADYADFYQYGFDSMINFGLRNDAQAGYEALFSAYSRALHGPLKGVSVLNYASSHDDAVPFDALRKRPFETANLLLLAPGAAQIYYGDETARLLHVDGASGDAHLRSFMNWDDLATNAQRDGYRIADVRRHWSLLGQFRRAHPAVGAGVHRKLQDRPYVFARTHASGDRVVVALDVPTDRSLALPVGGVFRDGEAVRDAYSGKRAVVAGGMVRFDARNAVVLIARDKD
jgi:alpha-amylase